MRGFRAGARSSPNSRRRSSSVSMSSGSTAGGATGGRGCGAGALIFWLAWLGVGRVGGATAGLEAAGASERAVGCIEMGAGLGLLLLMTALEALGRLALAKGCRGSCWAGGGGLREMLAVGGWSRL